MPKIQVHVFLSNHSDTTEPLRLKSLVENLKSEHSKVIIAFEIERNEETIKAMNELVNDEQWAEAQEYLRYATYRQWAAGVFELFRNLERTYASGIRIEPIDINSFIIDGISKERWQELMFENLKYIIETVSQGTEDSAILVFTGAFHGVLLAEQLNKETGLAPVVHNFTREMKEVLRTSLHSKEYEGFGKYLEILKEALRA